MDAKIKILATGDVRGQFNKLFQRVESVNKKSGPFEILLCVGDFFGDSSVELLPYRTGTKCIPVPTYILGPNNANQIKNYEKITDGEICSNLTYLGKRGIYTLSCGVKIAYLSGLETQKGTAQKEEHYFDKDDVAALRNSCFVSKRSGDYRGVDVLITSQWPSGMAQDEKNTSKLISYLCKEIRPRYHICGLSGKYFEPPPFRIPADQATQLSLCTRFISLANVGNSEKEKYIYALSLTPVEKMRVIDLIQKTTTEIECPFKHLDFRNCIVHSDTSSENKQFFFDMHGHHENTKRKGGPGQRQDKRPKIMNIDQEKCWFCLSSPTVEKHLVISIGEHFYLALAKGPINDYHVLILSITHIPCAALLSDDVLEELTKFKRMLKAFFEENNQVVCFTERHYKSSHLQINALGIDKGYAWKIHHAFEDKAEEYNLQFENIPALTKSQILPQQGPYFVAELPDDTTIITRQMKHFPLHFARDVFCSENLLNCDEKVNWKECELSKEEEVQMVKRFRSKFSKFDFTLVP